MNFQVSDVAAEKNTVDEAVMADLDRQLAATPKDPVLWFKKGQEYFGCEFEKAVDCFSMALVYDPFNGDYLFNRARKYISLNQWRKALSDLILTQRLDPRDGLKWHYAGVCCFYLEQYDDAAFYFKTALEHHRTYGVNLAWPEVDWLYMAYMRGGKKEEAIACLDLVGDDEPVAESDFVYKRRVQLYKGLFTPEEFSANVVDRTDNLDLMSGLYALVNYYYFQANEPEKAMEVVDEILALPDYHHAFAYKCALLDKANR